MRRGSPIPDETILLVLDMHRRDGMSFGDIARRLHMTKGSIAGLVYRVDRDTDLVDETPHLNGTMPPGWWRKGLENRK